MVMTKYSEMGSTHQEILLGDPIESAEKLMTELHPVSRRSMVRAVTAERNVILLRLSIMTLAYLFALYSMKGRYPNDLKCFIAVIVGTIIIGMAATCINVTRRVNRLSALSDSEPSRSEMTDIRRIKE